MIWWLILSAYVFGYWRTVPRVYRVMRKDKPMWQDSDRTFLAFLAMLIGLVWFLVVPAVVVARWLAGVLDNDSGHS